MFDPASSTIVVAKDLTDNLAPYRIEGEPAIRLPDETLASNTAVTLGEAFHAVIMGLRRNLCASLGETPVFFIVFQ